MVSRGVILYVSSTYPFQLFPRRPRERSPPPCRKNTGWPTKKLAKALLTGKGANTKNPFEAIPCSTFICVCSNPPPNFNSCAPRIQVRDPDQAKEFSYVFRGPVIGSPIEAYPFTWMNGGPAAASSVG